MCKRAPRTGKSGLVDVELGFAQTAAGFTAAGVGHLLDKLLGFEKLIDFSAQGNVFPTGDFFGDHSESEGSITDPTVEIVRVDGVWTCDNDSGLMGESFELGKKKGLEMYRGRRTLAPEDLEPSGPMLAKSPAFAIGDSFPMYESTVTSEVCPEMNVM